MKNLTKILSMLLIAVMFVSLLGTSAFAGYEIIGSGSGSNVSSSTGSGYEVIGSGSGAASASSGSYEVIGGSTGSGSASTDSGYEVIGSGSNEVMGGSGSTELFGAPLSVDRPFYVGSNTNTFQTLEDAIAYAPAGGTVVLGVDGYSIPACTITKNITLNLNNKTLSIGGEMTVNPAVTMTISNGTINGGGNSFASVSSGANLKLSSLTVINSALDITDGSLSSGGKATISSGTYCTGVAKEGVTITSGSFETDPATDGATLADGTTVTGSGPFVVFSGTSEGGAARIGSKYYPTFDLAYDAAGSGATIELLQNQSSDKTVINKNLTLNLGTHSLTFNSGASISAGRSVNVNGGAIVGDLAVDGTAALNIQSGSPLIGSVTNNGTLTISGSAGNAVIDSVTGEGVTTINAGTVSSLTLSPSSVLNMSGGSSVIGDLIIPNSTTVKVNVSGGTVNNTQVPSFSSTPNNRLISGGVWGGVEAGEVNDLNKLVKNGLTLTAVQGKTDTYSVGAGAGTGTGTGTGGSTVSGSCTAAPTQSGIYQYNRGGSTTPSSLTYSVTTPSGVTLNSVNYIFSNGVSTAGTNSWTSGSTSFNVTLTRDAAMQALPAEAVTVRFNFSDGSTVDNTLYVLPIFSIVPSGSGVYFTINDVDDGQFALYCGNVSSASSAYQLVSGTDYTSSIDSNGYLRTTLTSTGLANINRGTGSTSYKVWYALDGIAWNVGSFTRSSNGTITNPSTNNNNGYNSISSGLLYVAPASGSTWVSGDGDMKFITDSAYALTSVSIDGGLPVGVLRWRDYGNGYFDLDDGLLATLSRDTHTVTVTNKAGQSGSCTFYVGPSLVPKDSTKHTTGSRLNLRYVCSDPIYDVYVNQVWVDPANYGLSSDRKTLTIYADFLNARTAGLTYPLSVDIHPGGYKNASDADAFSSFTILTTAQAAGSPRTGDDSNLALWAALLGISGVAAVAVVPRLKKRED